jgi:tetratricopeptide (TPR) repeat protein
MDNKRMKRNAKKFACLGLVCLGLLGGPLALSAQEEQQKERETKQTVAMSQAVYEKLTAIQELVEAKDYAGADVLLRELRANEKLSDYERAQIWNLTGYSAYLQEKYKEAINAYEQVLKQPELPEALQQSTLKTMAQLQFTIEDYATALTTVRRLMAVVPEPSADVFMLEGQALFQLARYQEALKPIRTAVDMFRDQGQTPKENWLLLLRVIYFELKDYNNMLEVVKELVQYYPKDTYVLTLAGVYSELGDTKKQLALTEVLYEKGLLNTNGHITNLANLYLLHGLPYKAAEVLEKGMSANIVEENDRNLRLMSQAWYQAREDEKAIPPMERAAKMSKDGELFVRLAQAHINLEQWDDAIEAVNNALGAGGLKRTDQAYIMMGMAYFNQKRLNQARDAFEKASRDQRSAKAAEQWIAYVDSEKRRAELMEQEVEYKERDRDAMLDALPNG